MAATDRSRAQKKYEDVWVADTHGKDGPPLELFKELRAHCPVHWSAGMAEYPDEAGYWSVTRQEDLRTVSRDWRTYSSWLGGTQIATNLYPLDLARQEFISMDPPRHDRIKALFQLAFSPKRIAKQEPLVRAIATDVFQTLEGRDTCDLVTDLAQPIVSRVIGEFVGIPMEADAEWTELANTVMGYDDAALRTGRTIDEVLQEVFERCHELVAERRERPTDDLASVLVNAEIDGQTLDDEEIVMGIFLLLEAGSDSTKATYCSGMRALLEHRDQWQLLVDDPSLIPSAVEESCRMFPPFSSFRRTATCDTELAGQQVKEGDKVVMWYVSSGRDESVYEDPDRFDVRRNPEHQAFGAGGRHFCLGHALARLELRVLFEETVKRYPNIELNGEPVYAESSFVNQLTTLPVKLG